MPTDTTLLQRLAFLTQCVFVLLCTALAIQAQSSGIGDPAVAPGNPSSSYDLSAVDHINYYNGLVSTTIPTYTIGGRGNASVPVIIGVQRQWTVDPSNSPYTSQSVPQLSFFGPLNEPTGLYLASTAAASGACGAGPYTTYLVYTASDGTQTMLRDTAYNGQPQCPSGSVYSDRGRIFQSSDGTNLTFISNADILDGYSGGVAAALQGVLITRDGTRYIIGPTGTGTGITGVEDRNGNLLSFSTQSDASGNFTATVLDSLGRAEQIAIPFSSGPRTQTLSYPGTGGATRNIIVNSGLLQNALAPGESLQSLSSLFPELTNNALGWSPNNQQVVTSIVLADGTSKYTLQYNAYGEVTRLAFPTGGVYVYKYPEAYAGTGDGVTSLSGGGYAICRRLLERDEYADGVHLSAKILFSTAAGSPDPNHSSRPVTVTTVTFQDASSETLRVEKHYFYGNPASTTPDASNSSSFADWWLGLEFQTDILDSSGKLFQRQQRVYTQRPCASGENCWYIPASDSVPAHDTQLCQVNTTNDGSQVSATVYGYDQYNNQTDKYEFRYSVGPAIAASCPTALSGAARHTHSVFETGSYVTSNVNILGLPASTAILDGAGNQSALTNFLYDQQAPADTPAIVGHDTNYGTGFNVRGNLTAVQSWWSYNNSYPAQTFTYDIAGNVLSSTDADNNTTHFSYNGDGQNKYAFPTTIQNALGQNRSAQYDYNIGRPVVLSDLNGKQTTYAYNDLLDRVTGMLLPNGGHTYYSYPSPTTVITQRDQGTSGDAALKAQLVYDGLGRAIESDTFESASQYIATTTTYDALGRVLTKTNPSRPGDGLNYAMTYNYDPLGRTIGVTSPDGAVATTTYSGNQATATDQAQKQKQYSYDALGRLTLVVEDSSGLNYTTSYQYDLLDDLTVVTQGSQTRSFSYDSLKHLASATNPESGAVSYSYDAAGNLKTRTDARNLTTSYTYDALNRTLSATYPSGSGTPNVTYTYDGSGVTNGLGHLTSISAANATATNYTSFDAVGNIHNSTQIIAGNSYSFNYTYNLAGMLYQETYPSGRLITETHDGANRPSTLTGTLAGQQTNYITQTGYWPNALQYFVRGNTLRYAAGYNTRLQPTETYEAINNTNSVSTMLQYSCLNWGASRNFGSSLYGLCSVVNNTNDNGTLQGVTYSNGGPGYSSYLSFGQSFTYDKVNRLASASDTGGWSRNFSYDSYGNMWVSGSSGVRLAGNTPTSNVYTAANRISSSSYDASGNQLAVNGDTATYDAESRLISVTESPSMGGGTETLVYDGSGQRVQKILPSGTTNYVYDAFGRLVAEYSTNPTESPCTTCYLSYDHLGSVRMVTDASAKVISRHDFLPFGEELPPNSAGRNGQWGPGDDNITQKFTGQIRDEETDLDYFKARYFGAALGRFISPDPQNAGADPTNPQSWNGYSYVLGNPLANVDPTGRYRQDADAWTGSGAPCYMCGGQNFEEYASPLMAREQAEESLYEARLDQANADIQAANSANRALANGQPITAGFIAALNPGIIAVPVAPKTPDPVYNAFAVGAAAVGVDPNANIPVLAQQRGVATSVQLTNPATGAPYQANNLTIDPNNAGTADPGAISAAFHGGGNPSWYVGGDTNAMHVVDITAPSTDPNNPFQIGLQFHVDAYNPTAGVVTFFQHFVNEVIPGHGVTGPRLSRTCSVNGGCRP